MIFKPKEASASHPGVPAVPRHLSNPKSIMVRAVQKTKSKTIKDILSCLRPCKQSEFQIESLSSCFEVLESDAIFVHPVYRTTP